LFDNKILSKMNIACKFSCLAILLFFFACEKAPQPYILDLPPGAPIPQIPSDNQLTAARVALGKKLFFDPILSRDSTVACGSCHFQDKSFADNRVISPGIEGRLGLRNAPSLANMIYRDRFFYDGGVPSLELQVLAPIEDHNEMDFNSLDVVERLKNHPDYPAMIRDAYDSEPDVYALTRAIAAFERTLISGYSPYDRYAYQGDINALTTEEQRGMNLFFSNRTQCGTCHSGFNFSNEEFINIGQYSDYTADPGRRRVTALDSDIGKFKVPSLRNVAVTAPYMHDGSLATLESVIDFFNIGGQAHPNKSALIQPLGLTMQEKSDLIAFLKSLTDSEFLENPKFK
jgi:cytochrome c peroxidase